MKLKWKNDILWNNGVLHNWNTASFSIMFISGCIIDKLLFTFIEAIISESMNLESMKSFYNNTFDLIILK
jgi:hypothetical protein